MKCLKKRLHLVVKLQVLIALVACVVTLYTHSKTEADEMDESTHRLINDVNEVANLTKEADRLHNEFMDVAKDLDIAEGEK